MSNGQLNDIDVRPFVPTDDGEVVELNDGRALKLVIEPDHDVSINDYDCYGKVEWVARDPHANRPDGFDGRARKLWTRSDAFWWQPPSDVREEDLNEFAYHVRDLMEYGFRVYVLELLGPEEDTDFVGHRPVLNVMALGGVDTDDPSYVQEIAEMLAGELLADDDDPGELVRNL